MLPTRSETNMADGRTVLREGDEIQIGKYRATISLSEPGLS